MRKVEFPCDFKGVKVHFVGIKGTGMSALVEILLKRGAIITGSDVSERFYTDEILERLGVTPLPFSSENITSDIDFVVYSSAYSPQTNPDLACAEEKGVPSFMYSDALGALSKTAYSCGICGVHGKTTTAGLTGTLLKATDLPVQVLAGSAIASFGSGSADERKSFSSCVMTNESRSDLGNSNKIKYFVAETCEYRRHFMAFSPEKIVLTSVESDHQDFYPSYDDIQKAFVDYACLLPENGQLIFCADDKGAFQTAQIALEKRKDIKLIPYGTKAQGDYKLSFGQLKNGKHFFNVSLLGECAIKVPGNHNVLNACAALALCVELLKTDGKNPEQYYKKLKSALLDFAGGKRRSEVKAEMKTPLNQDVIFIDDYAHHPTAIKTTLSGYKDFYKGRKIIVDFMSHTYTRTQSLLEDFARSFDCADKLIMNKIYASARETESNENHVSGKILAELTKKYHSDTVYAEDFDEAARIGLEYLCEPSGEKYPEGYLFVTMGAGNNQKVGEKIIAQLKTKSEAANEQHDRLRF